MRLLEKSRQERELENDMTSQPSAYANDRRARRTILLVEDEPFVREATRTILEHAGFEVLPAVDTRDAMKVYEERSRGIDLVMTDLVLPGGTGQQLGRDLRQRSPGIVLLMTSGYTNQNEMEVPEARIYFLAKPYSRRTLVEKIEKILAPVPLQRAATQAS
jgi:DNA-binding response OmpR family regulator